MTRIFPAFLLCTLLSITTSCSAPPDVNGIYVHQDGTKRYYTMNIRKTGHSTVEVFFEGIPLDLMKRLPWSMQCDGQIQGEILKCAKINMLIKKSPLRLDVTYPDKTKQTFINSLEAPDEEIENYE